MRIIVAIFALTTALGLAACGGPLRYEVASSAKAPGADAQIVAAINRSTNQTKLEVKVKNLAPPGRIVEGSEHYVAWWRKATADKWTRLASISFDESARAGTLEATAPETAFDFQITAEKTKDAASPAPDPIFSQRVGEAPR